MSTSTWLPSPAAAALTTVRKLLRIQGIETRTG